MKPDFTFNTTQRIGVFGLIFMMIILLGVIYGLKNQPPEKTINKHQHQEEKIVQHWVDSVKKEKIKSKTYKIYPFNPNFITDYKGYKLGMSPQEIDRLHDFREGDKWINSKVEFQEVTRISDSLLEAISVYFKFPDWVIAQQKQIKKRRLEKAESLSPAEKADLNKAGIEDLQKIKGIGKVLSRRIVHYRSQIDSFAGNIQLKDIYGLKYQTRQNILAHYTVKAQSKVKRLDINEVTTAELTTIPYFDYELARRIVQYRITHEGIADFEELVHIDGFPISRVDRIKLYLKI